MTPQPTPQPAPRRRFTPDQVAALTAVTEPWLSCEDCFATIDQCIDALADGTPRIDQPLRVHLVRCPACLDEAETLLTLAAHERGLDEERLLEQLRALLDPPRRTPHPPGPTRAGRRWTRPRRKR